MRPACVRCRLGSREMAWFVQIVLSPALAWIWRRLGSLWRCVARQCMRALGLVTGGPPAVTAERGARDPEADDEAPEAFDGAAGMKRAAAASGGDSASKRRKCEEDEEDEYGRVDTDDEFYCDYDSTWEDEDEERRRGSPARQWSPRSYNFRSFERAAQDMQNFRHGYPNQNRGGYWSGDAPDHMPNLDFYLGNQAAQPDGFFISEFHSEWKGQYGDLERVHTFIQWLFPLREPGVNRWARPLTPLEVEKFRESDEAKENLLKSYQLMLDFYGIELRDKRTGEVRRSPKWKARFDNMNRNTHNNLRITRILKCLGTLGFEHYQVPLVRFFLEETLVRGELPRVRESVLNYFVFAVLDRRERRELLRFAFSKYDGRDEFVWCPKKIQTRWSQNQGRVQGGAHAFLPSLVFRSDTEAQDDGDEPESLY